MWLPQCLCPASSVAHLAYLLDFFWMTWEWLSPFVLMNLSLKHKGMVSGCLEPAFRKKGVFRAPMTPAGLQDSGKGGGSNQGTSHGTECKIFPPLGPCFYPYPLPRGPF